MLEIITGRAGSGKTAHCLNEICRELRERPLGPSIILLLPEHMTYKVERQLVTMLKDHGHGYMRCQVYGFKRFAYQVLQETGGGLHRGITDMGRQLMLKRILSSRAKELKVFGKAANQKGFPAVLGGIIDEFKGYGISPELLIKAGESIDDKRLNNKLADLALLYGDFNQATAGRYTDGKDVMNILVEKLPMSSLVQGAEIWLDGFLFFNPLEMQVLEGLFRYGKNIHVTLNMDDSTTSQGKWANEEPAGLFNRAFTTSRQLEKLAKGLDIPVEYRHLAQNVRFTNPVLGAIEAGFDKRRVQKLAQADNISLVETATCRLEVEAVAADIIRLIKEKGYKWRDIGVLIRDEASYGDLVQFVFKDYDIPYFSDRKRQCANHPVAELIRSALAAVQGWRYEDIFACVKTGFFHLTFQQIDLLENYCLEFVLKGKQVWQQTEPWQYFSRYSLEADQDDADDEQKLRAGTADQLRRVVAEPLTKLAERLNASKITRDRLGAIYQFLVDMKVPQTLQEWADQAEREGALDFAREHQQVWNDVMEMLDQLVEVSGAEEMSISDLAELLEEGLAVLEMALIPPGLDYVNIASFDQNSLDNIRALYILGANSANMPRHSAENIVLSDADRLHINQKNVIELALLGEEASFNENYLMYKAFTQAREYLWVSYALSAPSGDATSAAEIVSKIKALLPDKSLKTIPLDWMNKFSEEDQLQLLAQAKPTLSSLSAALRELRDNGTMPDLWQRVYNALLENKDTRARLDLIRRGLFLNPRLDRLPSDVAKALYAPKGHLMGSVTSFEAYSKCPFQYFAQQGLKLKERKINQFSFPDLGNLLHALLKEFGERMKAAGRHWGDLTEPERDALCHAILLELAPRLNNGILYSDKKKEMQLARLEKTARFALKRLCDFDRISGFSPKYFEQSFGYRHDAESALRLVYQLHGGNRLELRGQIDRIDVSEDGQYFMIMDYKTGQAAINVVEVYYGLKLQLLTYMLVASQMMNNNGNEVLPAGMLYFFLKRPLASLGHHCRDVSEIKKQVDKKLMMPGWVLLDTGVVQQIDRELTAGRSSQFIKVKLKKDGDFDKNSMGSLRTAEEFQDLMRYVELVFQETGQRIMDGCIDIEPVRIGGKSPCTYCSYRPLCGFDPKLEGYGYRTTSYGDAEAMAAISEKVTDENRDQGKEAE